jgi:hypothetical protein
MGVGIQSQAFD